MSTPDPLHELRDQLTAEQLKLELAETRARQRLLESQHLVIDNLVDPREALLDDDGNTWLPVGVNAGAAGQVLSSELELARIRDACRHLAVTNEYAIGAHELRISYLVGAGHRYTAVPGNPLSQPLAAEVQRVLDRFLEAQSWCERQQEIVRRLDRDGECFLRFFPADEQDGWLAARFVEPEQVATPAGAAAGGNASLGILCAEEDVETVLGYYVDERMVPAREIQHRKQNVDRNQRRGLPTFHPVLGNLQRIEKLLRNMSLLAQTQAAIAVIRKHAQSSAAAVAAFPTASPATSFPVAADRPPVVTSGSRREPFSMLPLGSSTSFPPSASTPANWSRCCRRNCAPWPADW